MKPRLHVIEKLRMVLLAGLALVVIVVIGVTSITSFTELEDRESELSQAERLFFISEIEAQSKFVVVDSIGDVCRVTFDDALIHVNKIEFFSKKTNIEMPTAEWQESAIISWAHLSIDEGRIYEPRKVGFYFFRDKGGMIHVGRMQ